jgi:hypothetical protein
MSENIYIQVIESLKEKGFTFAEIGTLTEWWRGWWPWLLNASAEEIKSASVDAFAE